MRVPWKVIGLAGVAGVAATGVVVARKRRSHTEYDPEELRERLHERLGEVAANGGMAGVGDRETAAARDASPAAPGDADPATPREADPATPRDADSAAAGDADSAAAGDADTAAGDGGAAQPGH
jgi:hypothetical protein